MKITNLNVTGFRSLKSIYWRPGDLNIVIGPNASGKSNLLELLEMLSSLPKGGLAKYVQSRGGINSLLWDGQAEGVDIELCFTPPENTPEMRDLIYSLKLEAVGGLVAYEVASEELDSGDDTIPPLFDRNMERIEGEEVPDEGKQLPALPSRAESLLSVFHGRRAPDSLRSALLANGMADWTVYQHLDTSPKAPVRIAPVARYETQIEGDGSNLISVLHTLYTEDRAFAERINAAMGAAFGHFETLVFPPSPAADQRVQMKVRWKNLKRDCPLSDLSDGTLRFLYLISILANPNLPSLVAIDEPETGLHPRMMGIVAECAMDAATRTQLILTTHSPEFLDAFRDTQPTVTVTELVDGATQLRTLSGEDLAYWLKEYTLGDIYRTGQLESME